MNKQQSTMDLVVKIGNWLQMELLGAGATEELALKICFATGQRQAMILPGGDLWAPAKDALYRYKQGEWDEPGPELAQKLIKEAIGR